MKKNLLTIILTACVMLLGCVFYVHKITSTYETTLAETEDYYEWVISNKDQKMNDSIEELTEKYESLESEVWNMMNKEAYKVKIKHDDKTYIYESDNKGLFPSKSTMIIC